MNWFSRKPVWWSRRKNDDADPTRNQRGGIALSERQTQPMGPWSDIFGAWEPRNTSPWLYEALREALPVLDGGIGRLCTLDGIVEVEGGNDKLVAEIEQWMANVPVNDLECGYQAFYTSHGGEHYEQGCAVGEFVYDARGRDVVGLRVADSKGIVFVRGEDRMRVFYRAPCAEVDHRPDGLGQVQRLLQGTVRGDMLSALTDIGFVELDSRQCVFALHRPEADNPYGTSVMRSMPFVAQLLLTMQNASGNSWRRFGDPPFHIHYGTKNRKITGDDALRRAQLIAKDLAKALSGKARGNSVDLATAAAADDTVEIEVIGANGVALEIEQPARNMLEQIVAGFGLPPWMLGITWSQASGIGEQQSVVVLQESETRFASRRPQLERPIAAMLRARGRTWKPGDWQLVQRLPNLMDEAKRAQAAFLRAQTALMLNDAGQPEPAEAGRGIDNNLRASRGRPAKGRKASGDDADEDGEAWAEDDPVLPRIERAAIDGMLADWDALRDDVFRLLDLPASAAAKGAKAPGDPFKFDPVILTQLLSLGNASAVRMATVLLAAQMASFDRGVANAGLELTVDFDDPDVHAAIEAMNARMRETYRSSGLQLVRGGMARRYQEPIVAQLAAGAYDGMNPINVARELRRSFDAGDYNWERLARSETAMAQSRGKLELYREQGVTQVDYVTAEDGLVSDICLGLAANGPYVLEAAPIPVESSHPNCRCTLLAHS